MPQTISEQTALWNNVLNYVKKQLHNDQMIYDNFFHNSYIDSIDGSTITVVLSTGLARNVIKANYQDLLAEAVLETTGTNFDLEFIIEEERNAKPNAKTEKFTFFASASLNPRFTFDTFVVGKSNREAYQAALITAASPGKLYNPLLFYSDSGLGKTHLLHAIGNEIRKKSANTRVLCISAEEFIDEYVHFVQGSKQDQTFSQFFKNSVDVLLIDDIQFLIGKEKTTEMFFAAFQSIASNNRQIVITSDQHPSKLEGLPERLKSRFSQGLVLSISKPDTETSEQILRMKIANSDIDPNAFDDDVIKLLAERFSSNVRELEGALTRLLFYTINIRPGERINMNLAMEALTPLMSEQEATSHISENRVLDVVANYYGLTASQLTGKIRTAQIVLARHIAMYLIKTYIGTPFTKIGFLFGGRDHTTVMNGVQKVENSLKDDPEMQQAISDLKSKLGQ